MTTSKLQNLRDMAMDAIESLKNKSSDVDIRLSKEFKDAFEKNLNGKIGWSIKFNKMTAVIISPNGLKIYVPNQWFAMAAFPINFMRELLNYRNYTEEILGNNLDKFKSLDDSLKDKKRIYRALRETPATSNVAAIFKQLAEELFRNENLADDAVGESADMLYEFVSNPSWWYGGKTIERTDFYVSPIVSVLNLVNSTQSYVADITYAYATDDHLIAALKNDAFYIVGSIVDDPEDRILEEREAKFKAWLVTQKNKNGVNYPANTVSKYTDEMKMGYEEFGKFKDFDSVFQITDALTFSECIEYIFNHPGFKEYDNDSKINRWCSNGFKKYQLYLEAKGPSESLPKLRFNTGLRTVWAHNRISFGAPGTGKSYNINEDRKKMIGEHNEYDYERVTFHPDYTYANFVGTYKPVPCKDENGKDAITYEYVPGPFMRIYVKALKNGMTDNPRPFLLVIEEINRADVAAVFGDVFQLLDRDDDGVSQYPIEATEDMKKYLARELQGKSEDFEKIYIPDNMLIWATMNSADQGVFPMDTAFKRRWEFTYVGINDSEEDIKGKKVTLGKKEHIHQVEWNKLRKAINKFLAGQGINEDKQLGPYFMSRKIVAPEGNEINPNDFITAFKNKVLMYLFEDAARQKRTALFANGIEMRYSAICEKFDYEGVNVFCQEIVQRAEIKKIPAAGVQAGAVNSDAAGQNEGE